MLTLTIPLATQATGTLTSDETNVAAGATVRIGGAIYTFRASPSLPYELAIGSTADLSLQNVADAINGELSGTPAHIAVSAADVASHAIVVTSKNTGYNQNLITTTETSTHLSWGSGTLTGGTGGDINHINLSGTGAHTTNMVDVSKFREGIGFLTVHTHTGATGTLDVKFQMSGNGVDWVDGDAFTQVTTADTVTFKRLTAIFGDYLRAIVTLGGTSPNYTISLSLSGKV